MRVREAEAGGAQPLSLPRCLPRGAGSHISGAPSLTTPHPTWASQGSTGVWLRTAGQGHRARPLGEEVTTPGLRPFGRQTGPTYARVTQVPPDQTLQQRLQQNQPGFWKSLNLNTRGQGVYPLHLAAAPTSCSGLPLRLTQHWLQRATLAGLKPHFRAALPALPRSSLPPTPPPA